MNAWNRINWKDVAHKKNLSEPFKNKAKVNQPFEVLYTGTISVFVVISITKLGSNTKQQQGRLIKVFDNA